MFFPTDSPHGLPHNPFNAIVLPCPIGWISSMDGAGNVNLAPYSFFNAVAYVPPQVMFAATGAHDHGGRFKDTVRNIEETREFVVNIATWDLREAVNASSVNAPHGEDEFDYAGLEKAPSELVAPPRVARSPVHLECVHSQTVPLLDAGNGGPNTAVFGKVIGIHIDDAVMTDGLVDIAKLRPIGRLGYRDYVHVTERFSMTRPVWEDG